MVGNIFRWIFYQFTAYAVLSLIFPTRTGGTCPTEMQYAMNQNLEGKVLNSSMAMFKKSLGSLSSCMSMCRKTKTCKSGFYNQNSKDCVGYHNKSVPISDLIDHGGYKFFTQNQVCIARGYTYNYQKDFCFQVYPQKKSWSAAKSFCSDINGLLLVPTPYVKFKIVLQELKKFPNDSYWIGMTDSAKEGNWKWLTKVSANEFQGNGPLTNIDPDKPNTEADCGAIDSENNIIVDRNCYTWKPFICGFLKDGPCKVQ